MSEEKQEEKVEKVPVAEEKTEKELIRDFITAYNKLCKEHGYSLVTNPSFRARDDDTYSIVLQTSVSKLS